MEKLENLTFSKAEKHISQAKVDLYKPEEDVVPYSVCRNAYYAVVNYLESFLEDNNVSFNKDSNVEELLNKCRSIDQRFNSLNLSPMYHPKETEDVWMNLDMANDFMIIAETTCKVVRGE